MPVLRNIGCLVTCSGRAPSEAISHRHAALAWRDGAVAWAGADGALPDAWRGEGALDAGGGLVVPGLVDCHTHLAFGGWRTGEFRERLAGTSYEEIARRGGGILATVRATAAASEDGLVERARGFLREMTRLGVTAVEAKSGYGLTLETELELLRAYRRLAEGAPAGQPPLPRIVPTFLGAHVLPPEAETDRAAHVARVAEVWVPAVAEAGLARFCDAFVEEGAFQPEEARVVLEAGKSHGLLPKLHADQLRDGGGAALAAELGAVSADHLEHVSEAGIAALAAAGVVAVTLPVASLYLQQPPAPARRLLEAGVEVAVATDFNPGTAPTYHLPLALTLACVRQRMTPLEALWGATRAAARAIGLESEVGSLEPGKAADFAVLEAPDVDHWLYHFRGNACRATVIGGRVAHGELPTAS